MNFTLIFAGGQNAQGGGLMAYLPFILILGIMYFLMIRPQAKRQKEKQKMLEALKKGDQIVTIGGIHGKVSGFKGKEKKAKAVFKNNVDAINSIENFTYLPDLILDYQRKKKRVNETI